MVSADILAHTSIVLLGAEKTMNKDYRVANRALTLLSRWFVEVVC